MSIIRKIAHNTIIQIAGKIISTFLGLIAIGMLTRYLGTEQFGWYITAVTFLQFVGILIDFGLIPVTAQMMSEPEFDKKQLFKNLLGFRFVSAITFLGIAPLIALSFPYPQEVKIAIAFSTISFLCVAMNQVFVGFYQAKLKMHIQVLGEILGRIALVAGLWVFIQKDSSFLSIMGVVVFSSVVYTLVLWLKANRESPAVLSFEWNIWKAIMTKMWPIAVAIIFNVIYLKGDILLLSVFKTQTEVGIYGAAYRVIDILAQTAMMLMGVMLPLLGYAWSRNMRQDFVHRYQLSFDSMMMLALPMTIGVILLADDIMRLVAGAEFTISGKPLQILAIAVFGVYVGAVFGHTAVAINKQKQVMWIYISDAIITLVGYLIFIPKYGMYGAAWMTVFSEIYAGLMLFFTVRHYIKIKLQVKTLGKILFASTAMGLSIYVLQELHVLILTAIGILVYGLVLFVIKAVSKETIREILIHKKS